MKAVPTALELILKIGTLVEALTLMASIMV
jgi:hypothetical protein